jgi:hypothetical protein
MRHQRANSSDEAKYGKHDWNRIAGTVLRVVHECAGSGSKQEDACNRKQVFCCAHDV